VTEVFTCLRCKHFRGLNADGTVDCEELGTTKPKLACPLFEPADHTEIILWG